MRVKAVVFDFGKVICFPPADGVMDAIASLAGVSWQDMETTYTTCRKNYDLGEYDAAGFYHAVLERMGVTVPADITARMGVLDHESWSHINPGTGRLMAELKSSGYLVGILSNMPQDFLDAGRKTMPVLNLPHVGVFSCEARQAKPDAAIYRTLLAGLRCRPQETVFFDDIAENVEAAAKLGIAARLWQNPETARKDLAELGVTLCAAQSVNMPV